MWNIRKVKNGYIISPWSYSRGDGVGMVVSDSEVYVADNWNKAQRILHDLIDSKKVS